MLCSLRNCHPSVSDPFADTGEDELHAADAKDNAAEAEKKAKVQQQNYVHIRIQQRNGRKTLTTLQGLPKGASDIDGGEKWRAGADCPHCGPLSLAEYDQKKILKAFKKEFACNGTIVDDDELGQVIQLQGDQRQKISAFL